MAVRRRSCPAAHRTVYAVSVLCLLMRARASQVEQRFEDGLIETIQSTRRCDPGRERRIGVCVDGKEDEGGMSTVLLSKGRTRVTSLFWPGRLQGPLRSSGRGNWRSERGGYLTIRGVEVDGTSGPEGGWRKGDGGRLVPATCRRSASKRAPCCRTEQRLSQRRGC